MPWSRQRKTQEFFDKFKAGPRTLNISFSISLATAAEEIWLMSGQTSIHHRERRHFMFEVMELELLEHRSQDGFGLLQ